VECWRNITLSSLHTVLCTSYSMYGVIGAPKDTVWINGWLVSVWVGL